MDMTVEWDIRLVRTAIRAHRLSFPAQVPVFTRLHRPDIQWRVVLLYFIHGWPRSKIAERYGITSKRVGQIVRQWTLSAMSLGYVDWIPSIGECLA